MAESLSEAGRASILRAFTAKKAEVDEQLAGAGSPWRWVAGVYLFPEGKCPYCQQVIHSDRIWVVEEPYRLTGRYKLDGRRLVRETADHPHVSGGAICMGSSRSAAHALFYGMHPADAYWAARTSWMEWLERVWNHRCRGYPASPPVVDPEPEEDDDENSCGCGYRCCPDCEGENSCGEVGECSTCYTCGCGNRHCDECCDACNCGYQCCGECDGEEACDDMDCGTCHAGNSDEEF